MAFLYLAHLRQEGNHDFFRNKYTISYLHHRKGYAYEMLSALIDLLHAKFPCQEFICFVEPENTASINLLKKLGYEDMGYIEKIQSQMYGKWVQK